MGNSISVSMVMSKPLSWSECIVLVSCLLDGGVVFSCLMFSAVFFIVFGDTSGLGFEADLEGSFFSFEDFDFFGTASGETN